MAEHNTQVSIAIISLISVLGGSLFQNWDKLFPSTEQTVTQIPEKSSSTGTENSQYLITLYYDSSRKNDAYSVKEELRKNEFNVDIKPLNKKKDITNSYIYFKEKDHEEMLILRDILSKTLDEKFNIHKAKSDRSDKEMRVFLADDNS